MYPTRIPTTAVLSVESNSDKFVLYIGLAENHAIHTFIYLLLGIRYVVKKKKNSIATSSVVQIPTSQKVPPSLHILKLTSSRSYFTI